jgi:quercetin dioxygenase-like cupin family protein
MQEAGATFDMPDESAFRVLRSPSETAGELVELELAVPARSAAVPKHRHPLQEEEYEVLKGTLDVFVDGRWRALREGESLTIAPGEAHSFRGASGEPARVRNVHRPALDFLEYFQRLHALAEAGEIEKLKSPKNLIYISMLWQQHLQTLVAVGPLRVAMWVFARVGRLLGYQLPARRAAT